MGDRSAIGVLRDIHQGNKCQAYDDAARFHFWKSPAEERAVGDGAFCFLGRRKSSYGVVRGIDDERRAAFTGYLILRGQKEERGRRLMLVLNRKRFECGANMAGYNYSQRKMRRDGLSEAAAGRPEESPPS